MPLLTSLARLYFRRIFAYRERDRVVGELMGEVVKQEARLLPESDRRGIVKEILAYKTRLFEAATVETLAVWGGVRGFRDALRSDRARELAVTMRLAFGEGDMIDTNNDDYDPEIFKLKPGVQDSDARLQKNALYNSMVSFIDRLIFKRFEELHSGSFPLYREYRGMLEAGQREDMDLHVWMLKRQFENVRKRYSDHREITELLVRKLGLIGEAAARIAFLESGGRGTELEESLRNFYRDAGVLIQFWGNDVQKVWLDLAELDTNPLLTLAITRNEKVESIDRQSLISLLNEDFGIVSRLAEPYHESLRKSLAELKRHDFDFRTHRGLAIEVQRLRKRELANLKSAI